MDTDTNTEITPALTAEEWERALRDDGDGAVVNTHTGEILGCWAEYMAGDTNHALAALALHGQPFGFTYADVGNIRMAAEIIAETSSRRAGGLLLDIAARVAALLPPE
jgi:hypothetical protein